MTRKEIKQAFNEWWFSQYIKENATYEDVFIAGAEWMYEEMIEKFCKWFKRDYEDIGIRYIRGYEAEDYFDDIKQAMEEEL